eukprot:8342895-Pyramimonas_sp.AAC.1
MSVGNAERAACAELPDADAGLVHGAPPKKSMCGTPDAPAAWQRHCVKSWKRRTRAMHIQTSS